VVSVDPHPKPKLKTQNNPEHRFRVSVLVSFWLTLYNSLFLVVLIYSLASVGAMPYDFLSTKNPTPTKPHECPKPATIWQYNKYNKEFLNTCRNAGKKVIN
jgi:hypothetical protein